MMMVVKKQYISLILPLFVVMVVSGVHNQHPCEGMPCQNIKGLPILHPCLEKLRACSQEYHAEKMKMLDELLRDAKNKVGRPTLEQLINEVVVLQLRGSVEQLYQGFREFIKNFKTPQDPTPQGADEKLKKIIDANKLLDYTKQLTPPIEILTFDSIQRALITEGKDTMKWLKEKFGDQDDEKNKNK